MKTFNFNIAIKFTVLSVITALFFFACRKTSDLTSPIDPVITIIQPDLTKKVNSSVSGFVTNENNMAVKDASVLIGTTTVFTDKYGFFEARNVQMVQNAAVVTVIKTGYFKGIKTYIATENKAAFFRIKLIPKTSAGTVNGVAGGIVTLPSGLSINFPASAIVNASTNAAYAGNVTVAAFHINPTASDLNTIMPGDLRGLNTDGELKLLTTYGMAAVELTGGSGELLQLATGKKATLIMPIPTALSGTAPATIPLWYFNETNGLWKQEGNATKIGNTYVGEVTHFSFWNYDVPSNYVQFNCTVVNTAGQALQNVKVKISKINNLNSFGIGYTDSSGYVSGPIPNDEQLLLEVLANGNCTNAILSQNFTTTNVNVNYGNVVINNATNLANITGTVINCSGAPVTNGYVILQNGTNNSRIPLSAAGTYSTSQLLCGTTSTNFTIFAEDVSTNQQGNPLIYPIVAGNNNLSTIQACGSSTASYCYYTINGTLYNADTIYQALDVTFPHIYRVEVKKFNPQQSSATFFIRRNGIALGSNSDLTFFLSDTWPGVSFPYTSYVVSNGIGAVQITEFGNIGQFIAGNFSVVVLKVPQQDAGPFNVNCYFRFRRLD